MTIGDLVKYGNDRDYGIGVVIDIHDNNVVTVLWGNGVESCHSIGWIVRIKEDT